MTRGDRAFVRRCRVEVVRRPDECFVIGICKSRSMSAQLSSVAPEQRRDDDVPSHSLRYFVVRRISN
jgi:hypothetical protein